MGEDKEMSNSIDLNEPVRGKPYLDIDRVIQQVESPEKEKQTERDERKQ